MSEPRLVEYYTFYGNRARKVMAADQYNAACQRAFKDTGVRWRFVEVDNKNNYIVGRSKRRRTIHVGLDGTFEFDPFVTKRWWRKGAQRPGDHRANIHTH
jgi:hypothetical protein